LVVLPAPIGPPSDPLRLAARELVQAIDDFVANVDRRYDRAFRPGYWREGFGSRFSVPLARARNAYCETAWASADPFHEHLATLLGKVASPYWVWTTTDGPVRSTLANWLREEPRLETHPAESWVAQTAQVVEFANAGPIRGYAATLSLEAKQTLPRLTILCIDVGAEVSIASAALVLQREVPRQSIDLIWKASRIWVTADEPSLDEGDRIDVTVTTAKPIARSTDVRIGSAEAGRSTAALS
jgi:hypothetical protein